MRAGGRDRKDYNGVVLSFRPQPSLVGLDDKLAHQRSDRQVGVEGPVQRCVCVCVCARVCVVLCVCVFNGE